MTNPYQSPSHAQGGGASPTWYLWFYKTYRLVWFIGTALIVGSWFNIVTPTVGWIGFALAGMVSLGTYFLPSLAGIKPEDYVMLDSRLLKAKDHVYQDAIRRFQKGAALAFDGVTFVLGPTNEMACSVVGGSDLNDASALAISTHANNVFKKLLAESAEFAAAVAGRTICISILSGIEPNARELCRVVDGKLDWMR